MDKKSILCVLLTLLLLLTACGAREDTDVRDTVKALTAKELRGRLTGTVGNQRAAAVIEKGFQKVGLKKYDGNSYLMPFKQTVFLPNNQHFTMSVHFEGGKRKTLRYGRDFIEQNLLDNVALEGPVVFGTDSSRVEGKIVVLPDEKEINKVYGNAGAILVKKPRLEKSIHFTGANAPILHISEAVYDELVSQRAEWIQLAIDTERTEIPANNVVGTIKGKNSIDALVLMAHFDHVGWAGDQVFSGAADNAAAVGVLMDLAKELKVYSDTKPFDFDIVFCALNGAESGLRGSRALADALRKDYERVHVLNLDAMGSKNQKGLVITNSDAFSIEGTLADHLNDYFNSKGLPAAMSRERNVDDPLAVLSGPFSSLTISQGPFEGQHTVADTVQELNFDYLNRVSEGLFKYITDSEKGLYGFLEKEAAPASGIKKRNDMLSEEMDKLKLNQYKIVEIDGRKITLTKGFDTYKTLQDIKSIFPQLDFPEKLAEFSFSNVNLSVSNPALVPNPEVGKVYEYPISVKDIQFINLEYTVKAATLSISVQIIKDDPEQEDLPVTEHVLIPTEIYDKDKKPINIAGDPYYIAYFKGEKRICGFFMSKHEGGKRFYVRVNRHPRGEVSVIDSTIVWFDDSREKATAFMRESGVSELIRDRIIGAILGR